MRRNILLFATNTRKNSENLQLVANFLHFHHSKNSVRFCSSLLNSRNLNWIEPKLHFVKQFNKGEVEWHETTYQTNHPTRQIHNDNNRKNSHIQLDRRFQCLQCPIRNLFPSPSTMRKNKRGESLIVFLVGCFSLSLSLSLSLARDLYLLLNTQKNKHNSLLKRQQKKKHSTAGCRPLFFLSVRHSHSKTRNHGQVLAPQITQQEEGMKLFMGAIVWRLIFKVPLAMDNN